MSKNSNLCETAITAPADSKALKIKQSIPEELKDQSNTNSINFKLDIPTIQVEPIDVEAYLAEDAQRETLKVGAQRFAAKIELNYTPENSGEWHTLPNGDRTWALELQSKGANSTNLELANLKLAPGATLSIYGEDTTDVIIFSQDDNSPSQITWPLPGDSITLEYHEPADLLASSEFEIAFLGYGYRDSFSGNTHEARETGGSGSCNVNVACVLDPDANLPPDPNYWQPQINSAGILVSGGLEGFEFCSGTLINNEDAEPYFLTANHCGVSVGDLVRFEWESETCVGNAFTGNLADTTVRVEQTLINGSPDFTLVALDSYANGPEVLEIPDLYYSGWDANLYHGAEQMAIHHPNGDLKKISFDHDAIDYDGQKGPQYIRILDWDIGTTEPGSSGSGLWSTETGLLIGQLHGGFASCTSQTEDWYGALYYSYIAGLDTYLGSGDNNTMQATHAFNLTEGYDIAVQRITGLAYSACDVGNDGPIIITLANKGTDDITETILLAYGIKDKDGITLQEDTASIDVDLYSLQNEGLNTHEYQIDDAEILLPYANGETYIFFAEATLVGDANPDNNEKELEFIRSLDTAQLLIELTTDNYPQETSWDVTIIDAENNEITVAMGSGYSAQQQLYSEEPCLVPGEYTFTIYDDYGDGIHYDGVYGDLIISIDDETIYDLEQNNTDFGSSLSIEFTIESTYVYGDMNGDGYVDVIDVIALVNIILDEEAMCPPQGDLNSSGECDVIDVIALINIILERDDADKNLDEDGIF